MSRMSEGPHANSSIRLNFVNNYILYIESSVMFISKKIANLIVLINPFKLYSNYLEWFCNCYFNIALLALLYFIDKKSFFVKY